MRVSVVIPAFNEEKHILPTLEALAAQTLDPADFEILLVDNGSTDRTLPLAEPFTHTLPLRILSRTRAPISAVRNTGAAAARAPVLAFLDADCVPPPAWLASALDLAPPHALWGAHYLVPLDATWVGNTWFRFQATEKAGPVNFLPGGTLFVRRPDLDRLGGWNESLETSEDVDLCARARAAGLQVLAFPTLAVFHRGTPRTLGHFYRQNRWHGRHVFRSFLADLPSSRNLPLVALSFWTLLCFWATLLLPAWAIPHHHFLLALLPLVLLLAPALLMAARRAAASRAPSALPALSVLYLTYFLARAASLTHISRHRRR